MRYLSSTRVTGSLHGTLFLFLLLLYIFYFNIFICTLKFLIYFYDALRRCEENEKAWERVGSKRGQYCSSIYTLHMHAGRGSTADLPHRKKRTQLPPFSPWLNCGSWADFKYAMAQQIYIYIIINIIIIIHYVYYVYVHYSRIGSRKHATNEQIRVNIFFISFGTFAAKLIQILWCDERFFRIDFVI